MVFLSFTFSTATLGLQYGYPPALVRLPSRLGSATLSLKRSGRMGTVPVPLLVYPRMRLSRGVAICLA